MRESEKRILEYIKSRKDTILKDMCKDLKMKPSNASNALRSLKQGGRVSRAVSMKDGRVVVYNYIPLEKI